MTKDKLKEAWMAGARVGAETAYEIMLGALENMGKKMGFKKRKRSKRKKTPTGPPS